MDAKYHRETAEIYDFVLATKPAARGKVVTNLGMAEIVSIRSKAMPVPARKTVENGPDASVGSGWYHDAAIHDVEPPFRH